MPEDFLLLLATRLKNVALWKATLVSEHYADRSQLTKCFALVACFACYKSIMIPYYWQF